MGLQPLVQDMPLRITQTDHNRKDKRMFKNSRCRLYGWELHPVDEERFRNNTALEFVLQYMPECLYLQFPEATWIEIPELGPGIPHTSKLSYPSDKIWIQVCETALASI